MNEIQATCCKCGSGLKYPVTIGGEVYGTTCASKHLGIHDIPEHFSGDYDDYKAKKKISDEAGEADNEKRREEYEAHKAKVDEWCDKYRDDMKRISRAYYGSQDNDWENSFVVSISRQVDIPILGDTKEWDNSQYKYYRKWEPKGLKSLSDKQLAIFERIEKKWAR